jgi:hypothetical protein
MLDILLIITFVILFFKFVSWLFTPSYRSGSGYWPSSTSVTVTLPHPEKTNPYRFYKYIEVTPYVTLKEVRKELRRQNIILKPEYEKAMNDKIRRHVFRNPYTFDEYFHCEFDIIGIRFLQCSPEKLSAFRIDLCYLKDDKIADLDDFDFIPPYPYNHKRKYLEIMKEYYFDPRELYASDFEDIWKWYDEVGKSLNKNLVAVWDDEIFTLRELLRYHEITDYHIRYIRVREIARAHKMPDELGPLLRYVDADFGPNRNKSILAAVLAFSIREMEVDLEQHVHILEPDRDLFSALPAEDKK